MMRSERKLDHILYSSLAGMIVVTIFSFVLLSSARSFAATTKTTASASVTVSAACTMSGTGTEHSATITPGTSQGLGKSGGEDGIGQTTLKVSCNDANGFAIYAIGYTNSTYGTTTLIGENTNETIATGIATSGNTSNWAMQVNAAGTSYLATIQNGFDAAAYHVVPAEYTKVASRDSGTDVGDSAVGSKITTTYGVFIAGGQTADTYKGAVKYTMVHPASEEPLQPQTAKPNCINYFANVSDAVGTMGCQSVAASATSAVLLASNFSREGYGFAGWSDSFDYETNANAKFYGPQEYITFEAGQYTGSNNGLALYAVWVKSAGSLQDTDKVASLCGTNGTGGSLTTAPTDGTANLASVTALTDQRDNQTYAIARLADGNCWMIENLRLEAEDTRGDENKALAQGYGVNATYGNFAGLADPEIANFSNSTTANSLYYSGTQSGTASVNIGTGGNPGYRMPRYNNTNTSARADKPTTNGVSMYSYGNYYSWAAAMANTTYYSGPTATDAGGKTSETANTSLCPSGWRLPYGRNTGNGAGSKGFSYLDIRMGGTGANQSSTAGTTQSKKWRQFPNNFVYAGYFYTASADSRGSSGSYWSSTAYNYDNSYTLYLYSSSVIPGTNNYNKYSGFSVRCVAGS